MTYIIRYSRRGGQLRFRFAADPWVSDFHSIDQASSFDAAEEYYTMRFGPGSIIEFKED